MKICIFCSANDNIDAEYFRRTEELGQWAASNRTCGFPASGFPRRDAFVMAWPVLSLLSQLLPLN